MCCVQPEKSDQLLISVIVPVYNVRLYLEEALDSLLHQTYPNLEILVIDDGSTDGSGALCDAYALRDVRIRVIHQPNRGLSAARNAGLDVMTGQAVAFLDPDDAFHPEMIGSMLETMQRTGAQIVICRYTLHQTDGSMDSENAMKRCPRPLAKAGAYDRVGALRALAEGQLDHVVWNKLYARSLWETLRYPVGHVYEDVDTIFRILDIADRIHMMDDALVYHRKRSDSISTVTSSKHVQDWLLAHNHYEAFVAAHTPQAFSAALLHRVRQATISGSVNLYLLHIRYCRACGKAADETLRAQVLSLEAKCDLHSFPLHIRAGWWMLRHCPQVLYLFYPIFLPLRMLFFSVFHR